MPEAPPLLDFFRTLKPNVLYTLAPSAVVAKAARLFGQDPVRAVRWSGTGLTLEAEICFSPPVRVQLSHEAGKIASRCHPSSGREGDLCLQITVLMVIARVLHGARFHASDLTPEKIEKLARQLQAPLPTDASPAQVVLSSVGTTLSFDYDTGTRGPSWLSDGPPSGMEWLAWQKSEPERSAEAFGRWLEHRPKAIVVVLQIAGKEYRPEAPRWREMPDWMRLSHDGQTVTSRFCAMDDAGKWIEPLLPLGSGLVFAPEQGWIIRLPHSRKASFPASLPVARFNLAPPRWTPRFLKPCDAEGTPVEPEPLEPRVSIRIETGETVPTLRIHLADPHGEPLEFAAQAGFHGLSQEPKFATLLRSLPRRRKVQEWFARLLATPPTEREAGLEAAACDKVFTNRLMHGDDAAALLRTLFMRLAALDPPHLVARHAVPWGVVRGRGRAVAAALEILAAQPEFSLFAESPDGTHPMDAPRLAASLPTLAATCAARGIPLLIDGTAAQPLRLDLTLRALVASGEIDWFELHPQAASGDWIIPREVWQELLRTGHYRRDDGLLMVPDAASLEGLRAMEAVLAREGARVPRLRLFEWLALREQGIRCELPPQEAQVLDSLLRLREIEPVPVPAGLAVPMRDYQLHGYQWLVFLYRHRFGACLADDMGLGKTIQTIALLLALKEGVLGERPPGLPHLIVLPPTLLFNWQNELARFAPALTWREVTGPACRADFSDADIVLASYDRVRRDIDLLRDIPFDVVVFDEAQAVKNTNAARTIALRQLQARFRLALTGTPLENHISEFYSIMELAVPGLFGDHRAFLKRYEAGEPVIQRAAPFLLRRTREAILSELPPRVESDTYLALSERQRECYTRAVGEVRREVLEAYRLQPAQQAGIVALAALTRLRQICIAPAMLAGELERHSPKMEYLVDQLGELTREGHAVLVFSQFVKALDLAQDALAAAGLGFLRLDGSTPAAKRKALVEAFASGDSPGIFLLSLKAGGAGLNLPRASYVYHLDPWWNPAVEAQANARAHRIGQSRSVYVQRLLMRHTVEEKIMALKARKEALFQTVVGGQETASGPASLRAEDFRFLLEGLPEG